jgi:hypothetical protein
MVGRLMFGNPKRLPITLALRGLSTGNDDRSTARSSDSNVYLNMRPRLVEQRGMIEQLKYSKDRTFLQQSEVQMPA